MAQSSTPQVSPEKFPLGQRVSLSGHFLEPVTLEGIRFIGSGYECRVRLADGTPDEAIPMNLSPIVTFRQRVEWCRKYHKAWTDGKPGPIRTMESQLTKHILPRFGSLPLDSVDETAVQEFVADLKRTTFELRKPNRDLIKTYRLSRKTILNIVGVVKLILGKKIWMTWDLDLGKPEGPEQRYFTEEQLKSMIEAAEGQNRVLFALLAGTGMRIGEAAGLHVDDLDLDNCVIYVRRGVWNGQELSPKTKNAVREIDTDSGLAEMLRQHIGMMK